MCSCTHGRNWRPTKVCPPILQDHEPVGFCPAITLSHPESLCCYMRISRKIWHKSLPGPLHPHYLMRKCSLVLFLSTSIHCFHNHSISQTSMSLSSQASLGGRDVSSSFYRWGTDMQARFFLALDQTGSCGWPRSWTETSDSQSSALADHKTSLPSLVFTTLMVALSLG